MVVRVAAVAGRRRQLPATASASAAPLVVCAAARLMEMLCTAGTMNAAPPTTAPRFNVSRREIPDEDRSPGPIALSLIATSPINGEHTPAAATFHRERRS